MKDSVGDSSGRDCSMTLELLLKFGATTRKKRKDMKGIRVFLTNVLEKRTTTCLRN